MKNTFRFFGIFVLLYMVFSRMITIVNVQMTGWQFIVFVIVLTLIADYAVSKKSAFS